MIEDYFKSGSLSPVTKKHNQYRRALLNTKEFTNSREVIEKILNEENLGYLGLSLDDQPIVVPLNYVYEGGIILFHCALEGQKLDYVRKNNVVCFTVARQNGTIEQHKNNDPCQVDSESVMCFGKARIIEDLPERHSALNLFNRRFKPDAEEISMDRTERCYAVEIKINEMTARREINQKRSFWRYSFNEQEMKIESTSAKILSTVGK